MGSSDWKIGTSAGLCGELIGDTLRACAEAGLAWVEALLWGEWLQVGGDPAARCVALRREGEKRGVRFWSAHLPFGNAWDVSVPDVTERRRIVAALGELLPLAADLGARKAVIHGSYEPLASGEREARIEACRDSLSRLSDRAARAGLQLALECLPRTCLGNTSGEVRLLIEGLPALGVCCDTNHLLQERAEGFIAALGSRIVTLHVSDYDGVDERHWLPGRGVNNWKAIVAALEGAGYDGPVMFEVDRRGPGGPVTPADLRACWDGMR